MKPSDSPARVLERVHRSRRKGRRERLVGDFNRLFARLSSPDKDRFIEHAIETGDKPAPTLELLEQVERRNLDLWEMLTGEVFGRLSKAKRLALQAYEADGERADEETRWRASKDGRGHARGVWTGARAGEPWFRRLQEQLELENATGDALDHFEAMAIFWSFGKDLGRYSKRRKLNLHNEKTKTFIIAEAAPGAAIGGATGAELVSQSLENERLQRRLPGDWQRKHWDGAALHFGFLDDENRSVNRAFWKIPVPDYGRDRDGFAPIVDPVLPARERERLWISEKQLETEYRRVRAWTLRRVDRRHAVIWELQSLAKAAGRIYIPPAPKKPLKYFGSQKARPIDRWQDRAECSGRVEVTDERHLYVPPRPKRPVKFVDGRPVWRDRVDCPPKSVQCRRVAHEVEKPAIPAGLPQLLELSKLTRKPVDELAKMNYRHPPAITPFVRAQMDRLRIHRLRHWRWGSKAHWADRVRSDRSHGFLCERGVASTSLPLDA